MGYKAKPLKRKCVVDLYNFDVVKNEVEGGDICGWMVRWMDG